MEVFKIPCNVLGNMKISCDIKNSKVVFWSKFQIIIYDNLNFTNYSKKIEPMFKIKELIVIKDCLVCLDCSGNVNVNTIETFSIWKQNIICICACKIINTPSVYVVSLQFEQNSAKLYVNEFDIQSDSPNENIVLELKMPNESWVAPGESSIMVCGHIKSECLPNVKNVFYTEILDSNYLLIILSLDKRNVHGILLPKNNKLRSPNLWVKLYKSCTDIVDIKITIVTEICILIGLAGGNIIRISLLVKNQTPKVFHLNSAIYKFTMIGNGIIFTDGEKMWKNENILSKSDCIFEQFAVMNISDFQLINDQLICITFSNMVYFFNINDRTCYKTTFDTLDYCCEAMLVTDSDYVKEIMEIVEKNNELLKKKNKESEYLMALSLSQRQDLMNELIQVTFSVFDDYRELASAYTNLTLTEEFNNYYDTDLYYFLINLSVKSIHHKLNKLLSDVLGDIKIHITLFAHEFLKTTSIQIKEQLTTKNFVIPVRKRNKNIRRMQMQMKIITNIPGKFDKHRKLCTILYQKCIDLSAENFINRKPTSESRYIKEDETPLDMQISKISKHVHGSQYNFQMTNTNIYKWTFFVKLPNMCNLSVGNILRLINPTDYKRPHDSFKHLLHYSKENNYLEIEIGTETVRLDIDGKNLKVTCPDIKIAIDIRNFISNIIFPSHKCDPGKELIDHKYYTIIENFKKEINSCLSQKISTDEFAILLTRFLNYVYSATPL